MDSKLFSGPRLETSIDNKMRYEPGFMSISDSIEMQDQCFYYGFMAAAELFMGTGFHKEDFMFVIAAKGLSYDLKVDALKRLCRKVED